MEGHFEQTKEAVRIARKAHAFFAGVPPIIVGAALAECVATHIAGHVVQGDEAQTAALRRGLLEIFMATVEQIVPVVDQDVIRPKLAGRGARQ